MLHLRFTFVALLVVLGLAALHAPSVSAQYEGRPCRVWLAGDGYNEDGVGTEMYLPHTTAKTFVDGSHRQCWNGIWEKVTPSRPSPSPAPAPQPAPRRLPRWWNPWWVSTDEGPAPGCPAWWDANERMYNLDGYGVKTTIPHTWSGRLADGSLAVCESGTLYTLRPRNPSLRYLDVSTNLRSNLHMASTHEYWGACKIYVSLNKKLNFDRDGEPSWISDGGFVTVNGEVYHCIWGSWIPLKWLQGSWG
jgi:hypothetical protein